MQPIQTVYTDQYAMTCPHSGCDDPVVVSITRERGGKIVAIVLTYPGTEGMTESQIQSEDSVNGRRIRGQHKA